VVSEKEQSTIDCVHVIWVMLATRILTNPCPGQALANDRCQTVKPSRSGVLDRATTMRDCVDSQSVLSKREYRKVDAGTGPEGAKCGRRASVCGIKEEEKKRAIVAGRRERAD